LKIDKRNPKHWAYLLLSGSWVLVAIVLRPLCARWRSRQKRVVLYGHKLTGNLLAIHRHLSTVTGIQHVFLTMDPVYHRELLARGEPSVLATSFRCLPWLVGTKALISDHGLHALQPLLLVSNIKFFDVWHGIPFKGFDPDDFVVQRRYDEIWVTSPLLKNLYVERFGFRGDRVQVTGNPRTDSLVDKGRQRALARAAFGLPENRKLVLFAPTWGHDEKSRQLYPFGLIRDEFLGLLSGLARNSNAVFALRTHLNSPHQPGAPAPGVFDLPFSRFPDTELLLTATDILVCDWSSLAFDFLVLKRPTIFLDVPAPFRKGFSLDPSYRFGAVVSSVDELMAACAKFIENSDAYEREYGGYSEEIRQRVYSGFDDGNATRRCVDRLGPALR
jgi:CDP-glycerol glycerophosphotransferase